MWGQGPQLSCESRRLVRITNPSDRLFDPSSLLISGDGKTITHNLGSERLIYNINTSQAYWHAMGSSYLVEKDRNGYYFVKQPARRVGERVVAAQKERLSTPVQRINAALQSLNQSDLRQQINKCREQRNFKDQLRTPMLPIEVNSCRQNLEDLRKLQLCEKNNNCVEVFSNLTKTRESPQTSFVQLFESGIKMTDPQQRIGKVMVADSAVSYAAGTLFVANRKSIARVAARVGVRFNMVASLLFLASTLTKPMLLAFIDYDDCGDNGFASGQGRSLDDCLGQSAKRIQSLFHDELLMSLENPNQFINDITKNPDGRIGRLSCYAFESMLNDWKKKYAEYNNMQCQGRMITLGNRKTYIVHRDGHIYRHQDMDKTYHFYPGGKLIVENRNNGKRHEAIFTSEVNEYIHKGNPDRAEVAQRRDEVQSWMTPQYIWEEQFMINLIYSKISSQIENGVCRTETSVEASSSQ